MPATQFGDPEKYMAYVARVIREAGWVSRAASITSGGLKCTADTAVRYFETVLEGEGADFAPTQDDFRTAREARLWCLDQNDKFRGWGQRRGNRGSTAFDFKRRQVEAVNAASAHQGNIAFLATVVNGYLVMRNSANLLNKQAQSMVNKRITGVYDQIARRSGQKRAPLNRDYWPENIRDRKRPTGKDVVYFADRKTPGCFDNFKTELYAPRGCDTCMFASACIPNTAMIPAEKQRRAPQKNALSEERPVRRVIVRKA